MRSPPDRLSQTIPLSPPAGSRYRSTDSPGEGDTAETGARRAREGIVNVCSAHEGFNFISDAPNADVCFRSFSMPSVYFYPQLVLASL